MSYIGDGIADHIGGKVFKAVVVGAVIFGAFFWLGRASVAWF